MSETFGYFWQAAHKRDRDEVLPSPRPVLMTSPVLIGDCATPLLGGTMLSHLLKDEEDD